MTLAHDLHARNHFDSLMGLFHVPWDELCPYICESDRQHIRQALAAESIHPAPIDHPSAVLSAACPSACRTAAVAAEAALLSALRGHIARSNIYIASATETLTQVSVAAHPLFFLMHLSIGRAWVFFFRLRRCSKYRLTSCAL